VKGIDPIWLTVIATLVAIDQWIGGGKVSLDHVFPGDWIPWIVGWAGFLGGIFGFILAALTTIISTKPGILISAPATVVKAVAMIAIVLTALFGFGGSAEAATLPKPRPAAASVDPLQKIMDDISAKSATFVAGVIAAIQEADDDAAVLAKLTARVAVTSPDGRLLSRKQLAVLALVGTGAMVVVGWIVEAGVKWAVGWIIGAILKVKLGG
jgi:hypothetical protein